MHYARRFVNYKFWKLWHVLFFSIGFRPKLDPNREITIGAQQHFTAIQAFKRYHGIIENTKATFKRGLLIDLHGNSKDNGVTEIGYCLPKMNLISNDFDIKQSSIGTLAMENPHLDLITGRYSFGDFVEAEGIPAVPSSQNPKPGKNPLYCPDTSFCHVKLKYVVQDN